MDLRHHLRNAELPEEEFEAALEKDAATRRYNRVITAALQNDNICWCLEHGDLDLAFKVAEKLSWMRHPND